MTLEALEAALAEIERLRAALNTIADPNNTRLDAGVLAVSRALQKVARAALEQKSP
jgi:RNase P/RNase MRP subunit POP5